MNTKHQTQNWQGNRFEKRLVSAVNRFLLKAGVLSIAIALSACGGGSSSNSTSVSAYQFPLGLRDFPYCEVVPNTVANGIVTEHVSNNIKYGPCSSAQFATVSEQNIIDAYNASYLGN